MVIITSFRSPANLDSLVKHLENDGMTPIEFILSRGKSFGEWTVSKGCAIDDVVFFLCAESSVESANRVCEEALGAGNPDIITSAKRELMLHKCYAGNIMAVGKVASSPAKVASELEIDFAPGSWHAEIANYHLLKNPISIDRFEDFITMDEGVVTKLDADQAGRLLGIVMFGNLR